MDICEKAAYLKGLYEGFGLGTATPEGKLLSELIGLVSEMSETINNLEVECKELRDYCEELDEDLGDLEELLYEEELDEDEEYEDDEEFEADEYYEVTCPACGEIVCFNEEVDPSDLTCPACGDKFDATCDPDNCEACGEDCANKE